MYLIGDHHAGKFPKFIDAGLKPAAMGIDKGDPGEFSLYFRNRK